MTASEPQTRFEELSQRQQRKRRLGLLLWLLPLLLAFVLLWLARDETRLVQKAAGVAESLQQTLGDPPADGLEPLVREPPTDEPVTIVRVLEDHSSRLGQLESDRPEPLEPPDPSPPTDVTDLELQIQALAAKMELGISELRAGAQSQREAENRIVGGIQADIERLGRSIDKLGQAADTTVATTELEELVKSLSGAVEALTERIALLEREPNYRSLTVREGDEVELLSLDLAVSPGTVEDETLPDFAIRTFDGESIPTADPEVTLGRENSFAHDGCTYRFAVARHKRSLFWPDYLDIELLRSCAD